MNAFTRTLRRGWDQQRLAHDPDRRTLGCYLDHETAELVVCGSPRTGPDQRVPLADITDATITTAGQIRLTGGIAVGPVGLLRHRDDRELYLTVTTAGPVTLVPIDPRCAAVARQFHARLLSAAHAARSAAARDT